MRRPAFIARQSSRPTGIVGRFLARIMARETSAANEAALRVLDIQANERVLEIGFGHGRTVALAASSAAGVTVDGLDLSADMVRAATKRCRALVDDGRVRLQQGDADSLPYADASFDKALSVHTLYFWQAPARNLREICRVLTRTGTLVLGFREKSTEAERSFPPPTYRFYTADEVRDLLAGAGFGAVTFIDADGVLLARAQRR